jgi:hypothetical protein
MWLLLFLVSSAHAASDWKSNFGAEVKLEGLWHSEKVGPDVKTLRPIGNLKLPTTIRYGKRWRLRLLPVLQADPDNLSKRERYYTDPQEAFVQWSQLPLTVQLGFNVVQWGDTDIFNPLDVVNARRYWDPFRSEKLGAPGLFVKRDWESFFIEALYIPKQRESKIPGEKSRWMPRDVYKSRSVGTGFGPARIVLPSNLNYQYAESLELDNALDNNFGARVKFRLSGFDWTIAGFQGAATAPAVNLKRITATATSLTPLTFVVNPDVTLQAAYYKIRMTGTSFAWVLGDFLVKGVAAYTKPLSVRRDLPTRVWENALGLERTFSFGEMSMTMIAQGTYVDRGDAVDTNSVSLSRMFDRAGMMAIRFQPGEKWTVLASALRDFRFIGNLFHAELGYKIRDGWKLDLTGDILGGAAETPLGTYRRNDRATLALTAQF